MKLIAFAGALRTDSLNKRFAREALRLTQLSGAEGEFIDLRDYNIPLYDGDEEGSSGVPEGVKALGQKIAAADGIIISTPEYNGSIPGVLKNTIDWLSRDKPMSLGGKHLLLLAASPGALGGVRVLWHARQPFEVLGMHVHPSMMGLSNAGGAFDENGRLKEEKTIQQLQKSIDAFIAHLKK
jgi:chromate reductase